jgi:Flp pilus assembly protein TadB
LCLVALLPSQIAALTISEEELSRLETIFKELSTANMKLQSQLNESTLSLQKAQASFNEYARGAEQTTFDLLHEKEREKAQKDSWRTATIITGASGVVAIGVLVVLLLLK